MNVSRAEIWLRLFEAIKHDKLSTETAIGKTNIAFNELWKKI